MRVFLRTFNNKINSKSGATLPEGQYRGTPEWLQFQGLLIECLNELGHITFEQLENPKEMTSSVFPDGHIPDKYIFVHKNKSEIPAGDLFWMQMHMRDLFTIDTNGWGVDHSQAGNLKEFFPHVDREEATSFCQRLSDEFHTSGVSKIDQPSGCSKTPGKFILVPIQTPRDYTIQHYSPVTVRYFIDSVQAWANETQNHVCFKMHPKNAVDTDLLYAVESSLSHYVHKVEGNIHELIKRSQGLLVINSGTGFEGLIHGKPVATLGACDYNAVTLNADIRRLDEARNFLFSYNDTYRNLAYKFIWWYYHSHAFWMKDSQLKHNLVVYLKGALNA